MLIILPSCSKMWNGWKKQGWEKGYDSYQIGAYINGVEFHETPGSLFTGIINYCGFRIIHKDSLIMIENVRGNRFWTNYNSNYNRNAVVYDWEVAIVLDSASYTPGDTYSFCGKICPLLATSSIDFLRGEFDLFEPLPFIACSFIQTPVYENRDNPFVATEGEITIGSFDENGKNADTIFFDLKAEDKDGNVLDIKEGYCKSFYDPNNLL